MLWKKNCLACFDELKDEESVVRKSRKLSARIFHHFEYQQEGKAIFTTKFCDGLGQITEKYLYNRTIEDC